MKDLEINVNPDHTCSISAVPNSSGRLQFNIMLHDMHIGNSPLNIFVVAKGNTPNLTPNPVSQPYGMPQISHIGSNVSTPSPINTPTITHMNPVNLNNVNPNIKSLTPLNPGNVGSNIVNAVPLNQRTQGTNTGLTGSIGSPLGGINRPIGGIGMSGGITGMNPGLTGIGGFGMGLSGISGINTGIGGGIGLSGIPRMGSGNLNPGVTGIPGNRLNTNPGTNTGLNPINPRASMASQISTTPKNGDSLESLLSDLQSGAKPTPPKSDQVVDELELMMQELQDYE